MRSGLLVICGVCLLTGLIIHQLTPFNTVAASEHIAASLGSTNSYTGSVSCRKCHEKFYQLWASSHHGLAMQPYTIELARNKLSVQEQEITIGNKRYRADLTGAKGKMIENGPSGEEQYPIDHVLGGKNVYYFLTMIGGGRLQTLPLAYDVNKREWFDMAASGVRHFPGAVDEPIDWKNWQYTFNTSCYGCHVSQVSTNYDAKSDTYNTVWKEPGINCETCHGPADEHIKVCEAAPKGVLPKDLKIKRGGRDFTPDQNNSTCSSCHAKAVVITDTFQPGDKFFDHFGLVTLENPDYYPDGRDLGENYTFTSWLMSPCVKSGKLDCLHCHTSSGRYKFSTTEKANQACMPCHKDKVDASTEHTHHEAESAGNKCISCHMPMTEFARMRRTDHSMLPPTPTLTIAFGSPNACNLCHKDKATTWADEHVRTWRSRDYQAPVLKRARLIDSARKGDWTQLADMLEYVTGRDRDEVFATSLLRLIPASGDPRLLGVFLKTIQDSSPIIRAASAEALKNFPGEYVIQALVSAMGDECRLVRVRAGASIAGFPYLSVHDADKNVVDAAQQEYLISISSRPDQWDSHYNLGNYHLGRGDFSKAIKSYEKALLMEPQGLPALVNKAMAYARMGQNEKAIDALVSALKINPENAAANFNMGLIKAENDDFIAAEKHLRAALKSDPQMAQAAYNLAIILSKDRLDESIIYCKKAAALKPYDSKFAYTAAYFQERSGDLPGAATQLNNLLWMNPNYADAYILLGDVLERLERRVEAETLYHRGLSLKNLLPQFKIHFQMRLEALKRANRSLGTK